MPQSMIAAEIAFDRCVVHGQARQVVVDGQPAKLGARAYDLLLVLIEHRDRVISKNELLEIIWPGLVVEENNLQVHVSALRKLLGPQTIATIPGRGYRFTATLAPSATATAATPVEGLAEPSSASSAQGIQRARRASDRVPESPTLFGRDPDMRALIDLVNAHRLVTIAGAGGIGKTALAQAVARVMAGDFTHGMVVIDLAPLTAAAQLTPTIASALQVTLRGDHADDLVRALADAMHDRHMLIVLDNCEHLVEAVAQLASALLAAAPTLHLMATSQEPLKLQQEHVYRVGTLALPLGITLAEARLAGAVRLFESRAQAADARFVLNDANVGAVVDICTQLDGIALAIELAAARVQLLGVQGLRNRLGQRLFVLSGGSRVAAPRHRTLRAALEWSHTLLSPEQQAVFRRLGVMSGPFGLDASQQVAAFEAIDEWAVLDHLGALVEKSLVTVEQNESGEMRYRMLETMRQFALERLAEAGEQQATRERHLACFLALAEAAKPQLAGSDQGAWLKRLELDRDNLLSAHGWCDEADNGAERGLRLVNALMRFWLSRGLLVQGHQAYIKALARPGAMQHPLLRGEALLHAGSLCAYCNRDDEAERLLQESVAVARSGGFTELLVNALSRLGFVRLGLHDRHAARACLEEALVLARTVADGAALISLATTALAEQERIEGHLDVAARLYKESLAHARVLGDRLRTMIVLNNLSMVAVATGDEPRARTLMIESLDISDELGSKRGRLVVMEVCAGLAAHLEDWQLAARA